jgi:hypothetical protein
MTQLPQQSIDPQIDQDNRRAYLQNAPSGTNNLSVVEHHETVGIGGLMPHHGHIDGLSWSWRLTLCFLSGMTLPAVFTLVSPTVKTVFLTAIIAAAFIAACLAMASSLKTRAFLFGAIAMVAVGFTLALIV